MAQLSAGDRAAVTQAFQEEMSVAREQFGALTKADLRSAVDALDLWFDTNAALINAAIPLPARTALTQQQRFILALRVLRRRVRGD